MASRSSAGMGATRTKWAAGGGAILTGAPGGVHHFRARSGGFGPRLRYRRLGFGQLGHEFPRGNQGRVIPQVPDPPGVQ